MKRFFLVLIIVFALFGFCLDVWANNFIDRTIDGYRFRVVKYDTRSEIFDFKIWVNPDYKASSLRDMMEKNNSISAINWIFFCPADYRECGGQNFTHNERYYKWYKISEDFSTGNRVVFALDSNSKPFLFQTDRINALLEDRIYYWLSNFPLLLKDSVDTYKLYEELGMIDNKMKARMERNFVCFDKTKRYIYSGFVSAIELEKLPLLLKKLWCDSALNLDAGASSSMIYNWRQIIWPGRDVLDSVLVELKWFDTNQVHLNIKEAIEKVKKVQNKYSYEEKVNIVNNIRNILSKKRQEIYDKYSITTFWEDGQKNWYEIFLKDFSIIAFVYTYNYLDYELGLLLREYRQDEDLRLEEEKYLDDAKSGLF